MSRVISIMFFCCLFVSALVAQVEPQPIVHPDQANELKQRDGGPIMQFETKTVDYGTAQRHSEPLRTITFTNVGDEPLVIKNAKGSCGCTVPTYPKEPIMPGESSVIEVRYATNRVGKINKTIKITTNEGTQPHVLKVVGHILDEEGEESVPKTTPNMLNQERGN